MLRTGINIKTATFGAYDFLSENLVENIPYNKQKNIKPKMSLGKYAGLHRQFIQIPGQCDGDKLSALAHIMRVVPKGDLVEIGSFFGRSAFAIGWLAEQYSIGNLVCVDPWNEKQLEPQNDKSNILNNKPNIGNMLNNSACADSEEAFLNKVFQSFIATVSVLQNRIAYIRDTSEFALPIYNKAREKRLY